MALADELRAAHQELFQAILEHRFVREMTEDRIQPESFRRYLVQEGAFVRTAIRVFALALAKAPEEADLDRLARIVHALATTQSDYFIAATGGAPTLHTMPPEAAELGEVALGIAAAGSFAEILSGMLAADGSISSGAGRPPQGTRPPAGARPGSTCTWSRISRLRWLGSGSGSTRSAPASIQ